MNEFYVDPPGLTGLYNLLVRAHGDADDALNYTIKHCDLDFTEQGYILMLFGPHRNAYGSVTDALKRLSELAQGTGTQLNRAQLEYARTDATAAARFDATYPGATNPAELRGTLTHGRPDLQEGRSPFSDVATPTSQLKPPTYATDIQTYQINPLTDLLSPTAWIRQVSVSLFNYDPFAGWAKAIAGDWDAYYHCAAAWGSIGHAAHDVGRNLIAGAADASTIWRGNAAEAEQEFQLSLGAAAMALAPACHEYSRLYQEAAEAAIQLFGSVSGLIGQFLDLLIIINAATAVGTAAIETGVGAAVGYSVAIYYSLQALKLYEEISGFYQAAEITFRGIAGAIGSVQSGEELAKLPTLTPYHHPAVS